MDQSKQKVKKFVGEHQIFQALKDHERDLLLKKGEILHLDKNHYVIHEQQQNDDIYLLLEGIANNTFINDEGEEVAVLFYHPGDLIGIISAITHRKTKFSVQALSDLLVLRIPDQTFTLLVKENLSFSEKIIRLMSQRLDNLYAKLHDENSYHAHGLDTYPYRKKIGEIMSSPVVTAYPEETVLDLARSMDQKQISSLVILDKLGKPIGIVTQKDIIHSLVIKPTEYLKMTAKELMNSDLLYLSPEAYFYDALLMMVQHNIKHIPVIGTSGGLEGIVTMRNLTQARGNAVLSVIDTLEKQSTINGLARTKAEFHRILDSMIKEQASSRDMCSLITELNDRLLRKIIMISEQQMFDEGFGLPPVDYCWLTMGSEGRREQTLSTDQDNGMIYQDVDPEDKPFVHDYFAKLAQKIVSGLEACGVPRCLGNVMATNPRWRHSLQEWKQEINLWLQNLQGEELRSFTIFLDFRGTYGKTDFANEIRDYLLQCKNHYLMHRLAEDDLEYQVPLGFFGRVLTERTKEHPHEIDLKHGAVMHIVNAMRILSVNEGISAVSTLERLQALQQKHVFTLDEADEIGEAFNTLMTFRIRENMKQLQFGKPLTNYLSIKTMDKRDYIKLKRALSTAKWVQQMIARRFHVGGAHL